MQNSTSDVSAAATNTPKDLVARVSIIELFTLHVLPRNEEWEYAKEFISMSQVLDEDRKEAFLQALESIKEEKEMGELRAAEIQRGKEAEMEKQKREAERRAAEEAAAAAAAAAAASDQMKRGGSEGNSSNGNVRGKGGGRPSKSTGSKSTTDGRPPSKNIKKQEKPDAARKSQMHVVANVLRRLVQHIRQSASKNPLSFLRMLLFILGIVMALGRQDVRERVARITNTGWHKVKGTIGMGVKVSYI